MEWPEVFTMIKGMFNEKEMLEGVFYSKLQFRSGNNDIIKQITDNMTNILVNASLVVKKSEDNNSDAKKKAIIELNHEKTNELREVLLFLMLNTNVNYRPNVANCKKNVDHLYKIFDLLPPFLFMEIVWTCQLDNIFYEMLSYAPAWLSHPYYKEANLSLSFLTDPYVVVNKITSIFEAVIVSIGVTRGKNQDVLNKPLLEEMMPSYIDELLLHYSKDTVLMGAFKGTKLKRFNGHLTLNLLKMCAVAFKICKQRITIPTECKIYKGFITKKVSCLHASLTDLIKLLLTKTLNTLQNVLLSIDIDTYMEWTEIETDCDVYENLQQHIGALSYSLNDNLKHEKALVKHNVTRELQAFIIEPVPFQQRLKAATIGALLNMIQDTTLSPHQINDCMDEIFKRPIIYGNEECINDLILHADKLKLKHCQRIIGFLIVEGKRIELEYLESDETYEYDVDKYNNLVKLLHSIYKNLTVVEKLEFLIFRQKNLMNSAFIEFKFSEFQKRSHIFWNQFNKNINIDSFLMLCFECEDEMWNQLYNQLLTTNKFFELPWQFTQTYTELRLPIAMKKSLLTSSQIVNNKFFGNVFAQNFLKLSPSIQKDLMDVIIKRMLKFTKKQKYLNTNAYVKLLSTISVNAIKKFPNSLAFRDNTAKVIARVAYVMDKSLWKVRVFSYKRAHLVFECQQFLESNSRDLIKKVNSETAYEISKYIGSLPYSRQVMYYMRVLFVKERPIPFIIFMEICYKKTLNDKERTRMIATILMRSPETEFLNYAHLSYVSPNNLFHIIHEMMYIARKIDQHRAYNNFYYIYHAYISFLTNAIKNKEDYSNWHYEELLDDIMNLIIASKKMHKRLLVASCDLFLLWIKHKKEIGNQIINKLKPMTPSAELVETMNKINSIMGL